MLCSGAVNILQNVNGKKDNRFSCITLTEIFAHNDWQLFSL